MGLSLRHIAQQHPDHEKALGYYKAAVTHGADADMMKDNIDEANQAIAKRK